MYNQGYDEYFKGSMNYPQDMFNNTYGMDNCCYPDYFSRIDYAMNGYNRNYNYMNNNQLPMRNQNQNFENLYPEIYRIVYPMICKICNGNTRPITEELVNEMTDNIYNNIESEDFFENDTRVAEVKKGDVRNPNVKPSVTEVKEDRQRRPNPTLRDLIRILILRELLGNPGRNPIRPRPPFGPGFPGGNMPPMRPRDMYQDMYY